MQRTADIDRIVREVLVELGLLSQVPGVSSASTDSTAVADETKPAESVPRPTRPAGDVVVVDRVVTLAGVGERLASARRLVVQPRAVVTPAVRDELRRRNVALVFEETASAGATGCARVALTVLGSRIDPQPVVSELERSGLAVDLVRFECLIRATDDMSQKLAKVGTAGVLLSNYGAIAVCLANRHQGVRAVLASDEAGTAADTTSVGANLLVLEPRRIAGEAMRQIVNSFCRQGPGECPQELRDRLG